MAGRAPGRSQAGPRPLGGPADVPVGRGAVIPSRWLRKSSWERSSEVLIGLGLVMLMQPWSIDVYSYGFTVMLAGVIGYCIAGQLPKS